MRQQLLVTCVTCVTCVTGCVGGDAVAPRLLWVTSADSQLTEGGDALFSARVSDPQGVGDIRGGELMDASLRPLGDFELLYVQHGELVYTFEVTWEEVHGATPISFAESERRNFFARFEDADGHGVLGSFPLYLHCDGDPACDGVCGEACP